MLECNRCKKGSLDPSLELPYFNLVTDEKGRIYLPACDTVFRTNGVLYPRDIEIKYAALGWFECPERVGILPAARNGNQGGAYENAKHSDKKGRVKIEGRRFQFGNVWRMDAAATNKLLAFPVWPYDFPHTERFPELAGGDWDCLLVDIGGEEQFPKNFDVVEIRVFDHKTRKLIWDSEWNERNDMRHEDFVSGLAAGD